MKNSFIKSFFVFTGIGLFLSGCYPFGPDATVITYYNLYGQREIKQGDHSVILGVGKEPNQKTYAASYTTRSFGDRPANCFILTLQSSKALESVRGSYQYYSDDLQPLDVPWIGHGSALLFPTSNIVSKTLPRRTEKSGEMKHGKYKVFITYRLNGQDFQCTFDVDYEISHKAYVYFPPFVSHDSGWN